MSDKRRKQDALGRCLSGLKGDPALAQRILRLAREERRMRRKMPAALVAALVLLLVTSVAFAATKGFGILDFRPEQKENAAYVERILSLDQSFSCDSFTMTLNEAIYDGQELSFAMDIEPVEGGQPVYVIPHVYAAQGGRQLACEMTQGYGEIGGDGFWIPFVHPFSASFDGGEPEPIGASYALADAAQGEVEWTIELEMLTPNWPVRFAEYGEPMIGEEAWSDAQYEEYERMFARAYEEKTILLDEYGGIAMYASCVPQADGVDGGKKSWEELLQNLLTTEAFARRQETAFQFKTPANKP